MLSMPEAARAANNSKPAARTGMETPENPAVTAVIEITPKHVAITPRTPMRRDSGPYRNAESRKSWLSEIIAPPNCLPIPPSIISSGP